MSNEKLFIYLFTIQSAIMAGAPLVGNLVAWILRMLNRPLDAARVERLIPIALRLGQAKTAKEVIDVATDIAHTVTTQPPNSEAKVTSSGSAVVQVNLASGASESTARPKDLSAAPPGAFVLCLSMLFALVAIGCGFPEKLVRVVQASSKVMVRAEGCFVGEYEAAQRECLRLPTNKERRECVANEQKAHDDVEDAIGEIRDVRCEIEPEKCAPPTGTEAPR